MSLKQKGSIPTVRGLVKRPSTAIQYPMTKQPSSTVLYTNAGTNYDVMFVFRESNSYRVE